MNDLIFPLKAILYIAGAAMFSSAYAAAEDPFLEPSSLEKEVQGESLKDADSYYNAALFEQAIPLYEKLIETLPQNSEEWARARLSLGKSLYFAGLFHKGIEALKDADLSQEQTNPRIKNFDQESVFLLGLCCSRVQKYDLAALAFQNYLLSEEQEPAPLYSEAVYELGVSFFHLQQYSKAEQQFHKIKPLPQKKDLFSLSQLYLARIYLEEQQYLKAKETLSSLEVTAPVDGIYPYALAFLHGKMHFAKEQWSSAIEQFQNALPQKNLERADWIEDTLFYLGWSYLNLVEQKGGNLPKTEEILSKSEHTFLRLLEKFPSEKASLALGQCYLNQGVYLKNKNALKKLEELFLDKTKFKSSESQHHALLLRAEAASSYKERKKLFKELTNKKNSNARYFANAWYLTGINEFDEGQRIAVLKENEEAKKHLALATSAFQKAFNLLYPHEKKMAALSLKNQVQCCYFNHTREGYLKGLSILSKILNRYREDLFTTFEEPGEIFFLQGLIAANLTGDDERKTFFNIAESSLSHNIESYPKGRFYEESLRLLGLLYYSKSSFEKAEETFLLLARKSPASSFSAEAFFWASNCSQIRGQDSARTKYLRKKVFEQYPDSPLAAEAYFRYFDYSEYLKGGKKAMEHLRKVPELYPDSPFTLNALYLTLLFELQEGAKSKSREQNDSAMQSFQQLETAFHRLYQNALIPEENQEYFILVRYRALLEAALASLSLAEELPDTKKHLEDAERLLLKMYIELEKEESPFSCLAAFSKPFSSLKEECNFHLAKCYMMDKDDAAAERLLQKMIRKYQDAKITRGYYLSKSWHAFGKIFLKRNDHHLALKYLNHAEDAAKGRVLRADELLEIWIDKSQSLKALRKMDEAMLILSRAINYDAVSSKRMEAMFLRAELYEEQGRRELAKKQLDAISKKGGKWAVEARKKLEETYVYQ